MQQQNYYKISQVTLDMSHYTGKDTYSDGSIEDEILQALKDGRGGEMLRNDTRWPALYHLAPNRKFLLDAINFHAEANVLEIGCGCGAVTGELCRKADTVTAVEISHRRAEIAAYRNKDCDNLTICVGNLNDMEFTEKFDYVTLIGVLEYACSFTHTDMPFHDFLLSCQKFLKPDGVMIVAIENRLGMKYWSGAREDHTCRHFDGITGYQGVEVARTFSRNELKKLLQSVGFKGLQWFYPHPDYKMPLDLYSDRHLPSSEQLNNVENWSFDFDRIELFSANQALITMLDAGLYQEFANSFLVLCHRDELSKLDEEMQPEYVHHSFLRKQATSVVTSILERNGRKVIQKRAITSSACQHLRTIAENCQILSNIYGAEHVAQCHLTQEDLLEMEYIDGVNFSDIVGQAIKKNGLEELIRYIQFYCDKLLLGTKDTDTVPEFDITSPTRKYDFDMHLDDIIFAKDTFVIIDYEWLATAVPAKYILYKMLKLLYYRHHLLLAQKNVELKRLYESAGITEADTVKYHEWDLKFSNTVLDNYLTRYRRKRGVLDLANIRIK